MIDQPDPRLSEIADARTIAQATITEAVRKAFEEFHTKTGLYPEGVDITVIGHYTNRSARPDGYLITDVQLKVRY